MKYILMFIILFSFGAAGQNNIVTVTGHVNDANNNDALKSVNIYIINTQSGTPADSLGNFTLQLQPGKYTIAFSYVGYETQLKNVNITGREKTIHLNVSLKPGLYLMNGVTINANREIEGQNIDTLKIKDIQNIPNLYSDVLSSVKILPGVSSNNELTSAYNVRGGNFDENLIYLDGYEIYRPYLIQQGVEENQSIINGNMVGNMEFYNGAFPAQFGDKMSSALVVNYDSTVKPVLGGEINADLFNTGLTLHDRNGNFSWITGFRYAYPSLFDKTLQTSGLYKPSFDDYQFFGSYNFPENYIVQLLFITAKNNFELTPQSWFGNFQSPGIGIQQITLDFGGNSDYKYNSNLAGLKFIAPLSENSSLTTSLAYYSDKEFYNTNLSYKVYYSEDAYHPQDNIQYLETGYQFADNSLNSERVELMSDYTLNYKTQTIKAGAAFRYSKMESTLDESTSFLGVDSVLNAANNSIQKLNTEFNSLSGYVEDNIFFNSKLSANAGLRALKYYFNGEFLLSPRAGLTYKPDSLNSLNLSWGYYYQPPYFYETWDKSLTAAKSLLAQKDVQYDLSWEYQFKPQSKFTAELYYKDLTRLIPYYVDQLQLTYGDQNNYEGYAYGLDLQYEGELTRGIETWIGYSYLNAQEKQTTGSNPYENSPFNQGHTIRIFLQDHSTSHPNFQAHVLFLLGSGYYYYPMISVPGAAPGTYQIVPDYNVTDEYPFYFRVDMGLTFEFIILDHRKITFTAEVLNVFNQYNVTSYSWYHVFQQTTQPVPVPNILSPRYFNAGFKLEF